MRLRLDYGTSGLDVRLPDERVTVIEPINRPAVRDPVGALLSAIRAPVAGQSLEAAGPGATLCVLPQGPQTIPYRAGR